MPIITPMPAQVQGSIVEAPANSQPISKEKQEAIAKAFGLKSESAPIESKAPISPPAASEEITPASPIPEAKDERMEHLAGREKALQAQARAFKAERDAFLAEKAKASAASQGKAFVKDAFLSDPTAYGLTTEELSQATLGQLNQSPESTRIRQLEAKLAALEDSQKKTLSSVEEGKTQAYQQAVKQISHEVTLLVNNNDAFEAIRHEKATQDVVKYIEDEYKATGIVLDYTKAAQAIEDALREQIRSYSKLSFLAAKTEAPAGASPAAQAQTRNAPPTLTHALSQASRTPGRLTDKDRVERARLAFNGQLK